MLIVRFSWQPDSDGSEFSDGIWIGDTAGPNSSGKSSLIRQMSFLWVGWPPYSECTLIESASLRCLESSDESISFVMPVVTSTLWDAFQNTFIKRTIGWGWQDQVTRAKNVVCYVLKGPWCGRSSSQHELFVDDDSSTVTRSHISRTQAGLIGELACKNNKAARWQSRL
jgi:hypothetical protein